MTTRCVRSGCHGRIEGGYCLVCGKAPREAGGHSTRGSQGRSAVAVGAPPQAGAVVSETGAATGAEAGAAATGAPGGGEAAPSSVEDYPEWSDLAGDELILTTGSRTASAGASPRHAPGAGRRWSGLVWIPSVPYQDPTVMDKPEVP